MRMKMKPGTSFFNRLILIHEPAYFCGFLELPFRRAKLWHDIRPNMFQDLLNVDLYNCTSNKVECWTLNLSLGLTLYHSVSPQAKTSLALV